ncbi:MAG: OsmC family protein [Actinomycetota bacterium]|nr:OsmC family protein [Actinomycetota bacterium]
MPAHDYAVRAESTATFGRVLMRARGNHLVVDGPEKNGCPGEAVTPAELFLGGVATCAVELLAVIARERGIGLASVEAEIGGTIDRSAQARPDISVFTSVALRLTLRGVGDEDAAGLVAAFKSR